MSYTEQLYTREFKSLSTPQDIYASYNETLGHVIGAHNDDAAHYTTKHTLSMMTLEMDLSLGSGDAEVATKIFADTHRGVHAGLAETSVSAFGLLKAASAVVRSKHLDASDVTRADIAAQAVQAGDDTMLQEILEGAHNRSTLKTVLRATVAERLWFR